MPCVKGCWWIPQQANVAVDEHDTISVGGEQNFEIVLLQG